MHEDRFEAGLNVDVLDRSHFPELTLRFQPLPAEPPCTFSDDISLYTVWNEVERRYRWDGTPTYVLQSEMVLRTHVIINEDAGIPYRAPYRDLYNWQEYCVS